MKHVVCLSTLLMAGATCAFAESKPAEGAACCQKSPSRAAFFTRAAVAPTAPAACAADSWLKTTLTTPSRTVSQTLTAMTAPAKK